MEHHVYEGMYRNEEVYWWHLGMRRLSRWLLHTYLPRTENRILDVGCGTGGSFALLQTFGRVTGLDASPDALAFAKRRGGAELVQGTIEAMPFSDRSFDLVNCNDVLYHRSIADDEQALRECARVLSNNGLLLIREPAYNWLRSRHDAVVWTTRRYSKRELVRKLESAGFEVVWGSYVNTFLFPVAFLVRMVEKALPNPRETPEVFKPPRFLNPLFTGILFVEVFLLRYLRFPFGLSIVCVAKKRKSS